MTQAGSPRQKQRKAKELQPLTAVLRIKRSTGMETIPKPPRNKSFIKLDKAKSSLLDPVAGAKQFMAVGLRFLAQTCVSELFSNPGGIAMSKHSERLHKSLPLHLPKTGACVLLARLPRMQMGRGLMQGQAWTQSSADRFNEHVDPIPRAIPVMDLWIMQS